MEGQKKMHSQDIFKLKYVRAGLLETKHFFRPEWWVVCLPINEGLNQGVNILKKTFGCLINLSGKIVQFSGNNHKHVLVNLNNKKMPNKGYNLITAKAVALR